MRADMKFRRSILITARLLGAASCAVLATGTACAQQSAAAEAPPVDEEAAEEIIVTGFRASLDKALDVKRDSVSAVDAIVAEDIAKFPDQNLAESLQRIPGISIQRDGGEGRAITVRGLGAQFTRVRVNGLETVATSTDGASANRDRSFDFNVFASELFNSIVVHKTAEASLDEGSLGAVVDLNTGNPLGGKDGFSFVGSVQGSYNTLSKDLGPRVAGLLGWKSPDGTFGVSVSGAYSKSDTLELGNNTVRWAQARFDSVNGTRCFTTQNSGGTYIPGAACDQAALAFHPRIPRYGIIEHDRERLGITGSVQWEPSDSTKVSIDGLYSRFKETRNEQYAEVLFRSNERSIDVINPVYDDNSNLIKGTFNDAWVRTEWDVADGFTFKAGAMYRRFKFDTEGFTRDTVVCPTRTTAAPDVVLGAVTCTPSSIFGPTAVYGLPVTAALSQLINLGKAGQPTGTTTSWIIPNLETGTDYTNLYERTAAIDAGNTRGVVEKVTGGYFQIDAKGDILGLNYALNAGVRYAKTDQSSTGLNNGTVVQVKRSYEDWLPAMNLALFPHNDIIIRASVADVVTRPSLGNLTPGGSVDGFSYRVTFGNPFLDPFRATAYDLAVEWYFAPQSVFSVALFKKDIQSFPVSRTTSGTYASTGLPLSIIPPSPASSNPEGQLWQITGNINGAGASLKGMEVALQAPFTFLPGFLSHFGGIVNATFIKSDADYNIAGPAVVPGGALVNQARTETLYGLSKRAYNGTIYYEDSKFSARASVSYRSGFVDAGSATGNVFEGYNSTINVDASMRYKITEAIEVSVEGVNLTDEYRDRYNDIDANRIYENNHFGRTILFGARFKM